MQTSFCILTYSTELLNSACYWAESKKKIEQKRSAARQDVNVCFNDFFWNGYSTLHISTVFFCSGGPNFPAVVPVRFLLICCLEGTKPFSGGCHAYLILVESQSRLFSPLVRFVWVGVNVPITLRRTPKAEQTNVPRDPWRGGLGTLSSELWSGLFVVGMWSDLDQTQLLKNCTFLD